MDGYSPFIIIGPKNATNFPCADGVVTKEVYNFYDAQIMPDYAIIVNSTGEVTSRWYVEQAEYTSNGQTVITFRRDVLADFKDKVLTATSFIEKATVSDNDPAIYNEEGVAFNMIKKSEKLLKDQTETAWLVGYLSSDNSANKKYTATTSMQIQKNVAGISSWEYYQYVNNDFVGAPNETTYNAKVHGKNSNEGAWFCQYSFNAQGGAKTDTQTPSIGYRQLRQGDYAYNMAQVTGHQVCTLESKVRGVSGYTWSMSEIYSAIMGRIGTISDIDGVFANQIGYTHTADEEGAFKALDGLLINDTSAGGKTYRVNVYVRQRGAMDRYTPTKNSALYNKIVGLFTGTNKIDKNNIDNGWEDVYAKFYANYYRLSLTEVENHNVEVTFNANRRILNDAPYTMFAIPYGSMRFKDSSDVYESDPDASIGIARQISLELMSSGALYDLQLLPYCPRQDLIDINFEDLRKVINLTSAYATEHYDYEMITDANTNKKSFVLFCKESSFTFDINESIDITEKKVQNQCDKWRLCSPNYNGVFEFNAAKNNGVEYFNVDCTYRPYNPYIHVNPNFKELYGNDFDDARGLICSGDFSMPACTEKWLEYEAQNKNYQNSFDRSIQHLEIEQKYQRINQIANAVVGSGSGALAGNVMLPGGVGAVAGGVASAAAGVADVIMGEKLRSEQIRYAKDQFAYNLENIKAIPNSLAKISAFNKNNKIFPFLEYYSCTDIEREAFRNILTYDGMTVNRIGRIIDFLGENDLQYIRARLIRCDIHDDLHIVDVIASEMEKGAYYDTRSD